MNVTTYRFHGLGPEQLHWDVDSLALQLLIHFGGAHAARRWDEILSGAEAHLLLSLDQLLLRDRPFMPLAGVSHREKRASRRHLEGCVGPRSRAFKQLFRVAAEVLVLNLDALGEGAAGLEAARE